MMSGRLSRGWAMAKASFAVLKRHPRLAVLPMISGVVLWFVVGLIILSMVPVVVSGKANALGTDSTGQVVFYAAFFVALYVLTVIAVFFNAALIFCALRVHAGEEPSIRAGLAAAAGRLPQILGWALVSATVGVALSALQNMLKENLGFLGSLIGGLFEFGWTVVSYFVLPVLVVEGLGPIAALRRSSGILRSKWGESLAGEARFGLLGILFFLQALLLFFIGLALALSYGPTALAGLGPILMTLGVLYGITIVVVLQALGIIFQSGVYLYATTGQVPPSLDPELVEGTFRPKQ
jgi:hypothetical protein